MFARRYPFQELAQLSEAFDRFFNHFWRNTPWMEGDQPVSEGYLPLDVTETDDAYVVKASLPGLNPDDLEITFTDNTLTIKGEIKPDRDVEQSRCYLQERWFGPFQRRLALPGKVMSEKIEAQYQAGVLTLHLPKSEEIRPKRIQIQSGAQPKQVEEQVKTV